MARLGLAPLAVRRRSNPRTFLLELAIVAAMFVYYVGGNLLFEADRPTAIENARDILELQNRLHLNLEPNVQAFFDPHPWAVNAFVFFYAGPHFVLTYGFLVWTYWYRFEAYAYVRNAFALFTATVFAFQWIFPVAPPRMVPELGLKDTVTTLLPINGETPWVRFLVNDVAAVPSVHTGWSLLVAILAIRLTRSPLRWLWALYPAAIMLSVVATANHFLWDLVAAAAWLALTEIVHHAASLSHALPRLFPKLVRAPMAEAGGPDDA